MYASIPKVGVTKLIASHQTKLISMIDASRERGELVRHAPAAVARCGHGDLEDVDLGGAVRE